MWKVRELADKVTNVVMNYTEIESKVREATNDDPWGPTGTIKHELSQATYSYDQFPEVMGMLWKRIAENKRSPRRVYKSLLLLHHLLLHGSDRVVRAAQDRLYEVRSLQDYHVIYEPGFNLDAIIPPSGTETKDGELNVRVKAKDLVELVQDEEKLRDERKKARKNRDKYVGIGSDRMTSTSKWDNYSSGGGGEYGGNGGGGGGGGGFYDDEYFKKSSRSPSPPSFGKFSSSKSYNDSDMDFKKNSTSSNSFNNNHSFKSKPAPPSPGVEVSDDFDPRADEKKKSSDFGDFASAPTSNTTVSQSNAPAVQLPSKKVSGGDFADFQSAFGDSNPADVARKSGEIKATDDLLGLTTTSNEQSLSGNNSSLLSDDLFSSSAIQMSLPTGNPGFSTNAPTSFASFGGGPSPSLVSPTMPSPTRMGQFSPVGFPAGGGPVFPSPMMTAVPQPQTSPVSMMGQSSMLPMFGAGPDNLLAPTLEPARTSQLGTINDTNTNNNNNPQPTLKGTTWSDLNITMDDLNLGRANQKSAGGKVPMNQLKTNNTSNNFGGLL